MKNQTNYFLDYNLNIVCNFKVFPFLYPISDFDHWVGNSRQKEQTDINLAAKKPVSI